MRGRVRVGQTGRKKTTEYRAPHKAFRSEEGPRKCDSAAAMWALRIAFHWPLPPSFNISSKGRSAASDRIRQRATDDSRVQTRGRGGQCGLSAAGLRGLQPPLTPLQAADLLAYETRKDLKNILEQPPRPRSRALERLIAGRFHVAFYTDAEIIERSEEGQADGSLPMLYASKTLQQVMPWETRKPVPLRWDWEY